MIDLADEFETRFAQMIALAPRTISITAPDGTPKYTCTATSGIAPRVIGTPNAYDQERLQFTHLASAGEPLKFDRLVVDAVPRAIQEVRPQRVGDRIVAYRIIVEG